ncbi:muscarinic acetylcholine receptor M1 isoform X1 [Alosa sapidissima]|uniref:muscarinic acetylcholine receptor M1 isoform X1 n=2 Tax=Alosa sapidissima TaxID=34773 RepID=UPI001C0A0652|nr:muscarinic acetylcholine receptor M1 isoform X1 [Alosa sapidissima]
MNESGWTGGNGVPPKITIVRDFLKELEDLHPKPREKNDCISLLLSCSSDNMNYTCFSEASNVTTDPLGGHQVWEVVLIVLITGPLSLITILGNLLVVISFRVNAQLRTTNNYYLLSLAVADLILGMVSMNLYTAYIITGRWTLGHVACDIWLAVDYVSSNASVMNLLVISFDRYFSVTRPLTYRAKRTPKRARLLIALAWSVSFILWGPAILFWPYMVGRPPGDDQDCSIPFFKVPLLTFGTAIAAFYLPVCIMAILYWRIYWEIENRSKGLSMLLGQNGGAGTPNSSDLPSVYPDSAQSSLRAHRVPQTPARTRRSQKRQVGCFPKTARAQQLSTGKKVAAILELASQRCEGSFQEGYSRNSWSGDNEEEEEEDDAIGSTSTEEELEQEIKGSNTTATIKLKHLHEASDGNRDIKISPRATVEGPSTAAGGSSMRSSLNGPKHKDPGPLKQQKGKRRRNMIIREKKAARTLSAILLAFILTWTPYNVMVLASMSYCVPDKLWQLGYWLCYVNSTVNPMCYALCNKSFRSTFKSLLLCRQTDRKTWDASRRSHHMSARMQSCSTV